MYGGLKQLIGETGSRAITSGVVSGSGAQGGSSGSGGVSQV